MKYFTEMKLSLTTLKPINNTIATDPANVDMGIKNNLKSLQVSSLTLIIYNLIEKTFLGNLIFQHDYQKCKLMYLVISITAVVDVSKKYYFV